MNTNNPQQGCSSIAAEAMENYLCALYLLQQEGALVSTGQVNCLCSCS
jgi:hypothetical protein